MNKQITIQLSDRVIRHAEKVASQTQRRIEDVLAELLESVVNESPFEALPDSEVLGLTQLQLSEDQQAALSDLLDRNRENSLDEQDRRHLDELMRVYEHGLLRKSQALRVAVQRGLLEPLQA
jgi:mRNA-degrading endonuclease RelE of RelBE toxin-antitoxin system